MVLTEGIDEYCGIVFDSILLHIFVMVCMISIERMSKV